METSLRTFLADHFTVPMAWPWALGVALAVVVLLEILYRLSFRWLTRLVQLTKTTLDDVLVRRMRLPAQVLVFLVATHVFLALRDVENAVMSKAVTITELLLIAYLVIEATETAVLHYWLGERKKVQVPNVVRHLILVVVYAVAVLSIIGTVTGVNVAPLLATSTVITVVMGLALQDTLGNLFAGLALSLDKPFKEGEWILVDGVEGRVEHMGWRATHLRTFTWDAVVIPNSVMGRARLQNFDRPQKITGRNIEVLVALHALPEEIDEALKSVLPRLPAILRTPAPKTWFVAMTPLYHRYIVRVWVEEFAIHDDVESDLLKHLFVELLARKLALTSSTATAAVDFEGRTAMVPTLPPHDPGKTDPGGNALG
ncbi:MAG: mechanosensitive ion channel [Deltaproteobacteria bacterium]|nr:mechanosensitive ion channel [Deltaproteobacteria bacterium]